MRYLVDTDWVIDHLYGRAQVVSRLEELEPAGLGSSIISLAELYEGVFGSYDPEATEIALWNVLHRIHVLPLDEDIWPTFARERSRLRAAGTLISDFDLMIGATALNYGLTLLTNNRRHFERLDGVLIISA